MKQMYKVKELKGITEKRETAIPLVSIICTTYNQKRFIKDTLEGFLIQKTSFPVEIIIHDDASTDGTSGIIKEYESKYPQLFKPIYQTENQYSKRIDIAKEFVYPLIRGKYIATCEGDDYWIDPLKLQKQVGFLEENEDYALVYTDIDRIDGEGNIIDRRFFKNNFSPVCMTFEDCLIKAPFMAPCTWLFRKSVYRERDKKYAVADLPLILDILAHSKIHKLKDTTANYRVLPKSASHSTHINVFYTFSKSVYQIQLDYAKKYHVGNHIIEIIKNKFAFEFYVFAIATGDLKQIQTANNILMQKKNLSYKFRTAIYLSKFKIGRKIVRYRLIKRLGFTHK